MGWFKRKAYPRWDVRVEDFIEDDLANYINPHFAMILAEVRDLVPMRFHGDVFVCGGFAAHVAGITTQHTDVDLFCVSEESFETLYPIISGNTETTDRMDKREFVGVESKAYGRVLKFKYRGFKFDLVDFHERTHGKSVVGVLQGFDINWSMAGIDLRNDKITIHKDALSKEPMVNAVRAEEYLEGTLARLSKYGERLYKPANMTAVKDLEDVTQERIRLREKEKNKASSWY